MIVSQEYNTSLYIYNFFSPFLTLFSEKNRFFPPAAGVCTPPATKQTRTAADNLCVQSVPVRIQSVMFIFSSSGILQIAAVHSKAYPNLHQTISPMGICPKITAAYPEDLPNQSRPTSPTGIYPKITAVRAKILSLHPE